MKFCKRLLLATTAVSLTLLLSVAGSAQAQQRCQTDGQERKVPICICLTRSCQRSWSVRSSTNLPTVILNSLHSGPIRVSLFSINMVAIIPVLAAARTLVSALIVRPVPTGQNVAALIA